MRNLDTDHVQDLLRRHALIVLAHLQNPATLLHKVPKFLLVDALLPVVFQRRRQALVGELRNLGLFRAERLVQVEQFQWRRRQIAEDRLENL